MATLFLLLLIVAMMVGLVWLGYIFAHDELEAERAELFQHRQALDVEWQALENGRRINDVFFQARQAMREAERERRPRR